VKNWQVAVITACAVIVTQAICAVWVSKHVEFIKAVDAMGSGDDDDDEGDQEAYVAWHWK